MYYEVFDFPTEIVHTQGFQLAPRVNIQVSDHMWTMGCVPVMCHGFVRDPHVAFWRVVGVGL